MPDSTRIHTLNIRSDVGLTSWAEHLGLSAVAFRRLIRQYATTLQDGLAEHGVDYAALGPALVPSTTREELVLLFNSALMNSFRYGDVIIRRLLPLLDKDSTLSVMAGDILVDPVLTRRLAERAGVALSAETNWGADYIFATYLTNLTATQIETIQTDFQQLTGYLGHVVTTYRSDFRTLLGTMLPTAFIKHRNVAIVDHGGDEPFVDTINMQSLPFDQVGLRVVSVNSMLYSPLLQYKVQSKVFSHHTEDVLVSLNAISDEPMTLDGFEVLIDEPKYVYLHGKKGELLKIAGLEQHDREQLASAIRAELTNDYIYRLQENIDSTVQFSIALEFPRPMEHPIRLVTGLKYYPQEQALRLVTVT